MSMNAKIKMVDLVGQYDNLKSEIDQAIAKVLASGEYINGAEVKLFATNLAQYLQTKHVIPVANGTDALQIALMALGIGKDDQVIIPDFTFFATAEAVAVVGATPIPVDVDIKDFNIDVTQIESRINNHTKAIMPVHLFGQCANMDKISELASKYNLYVIEDAAQALGTHYSGTISSGKAGTLGNIGCTSFFPSKNLGAFGDGGAIFTNDSNLAQQAQMIANHGAIEKYHHKMIGLNSRLDTIQAAILNVKLKQLDNFNTRRREAADRYDQMLKNQKYIEIPYRNSNSTHIFHQYTILVPEGENIKLQKKLIEKDIPTMIYYPLPIHAQEAFNQQKYDTCQFKVSNILSKRVISLPMHTELTCEQQNYIAQSVIEHFM